jgi:hypothetical protein
MSQTQNYRAVRYFIAALTLLMLAATGLAAASAVAGTWDAVSLTPDGDEMHVTLTITESDGKLSATLTDDQGEWRVSNLKFDGKVLSFTASREGDYNVSMNVNGDKMEGTWSGGGDSGKVTATRHRA